jgi:hypothetical protein
MRCVAGRDQVEDQVMAELQREAWGETGIVPSPVLEMRQWTQRGNYTAFLQADDKAENKTSAGTSLQNMPEDREFHTSGSFTRC